MRPGNLLVLDYGIGRCGGQVFFIHNRAQSIPRIGAWLQRLLPEVRIGIRTRSVSSTASP